MEIAGGYIEYGIEMSILCKQYEKNSDLLYIQRYTDISRYIREYKYQKTQMTKKYIHQPHPVTWRSSLLSPAKPDVYSHFKSRGQFTQEARIWVERIST